VSDDNSPVDAVLAEKWAVVRLLDRGGCGTVYEGKHVELGRVVAIKIIDPQLARNEDAVERFRREARAASVVQSDHVVQVLDIGEDDRFGLYMVMELLDGEDVERRLWREKRIEVSTAVDIIVQAARGLAKTHAAGVIHRDLKPGNLFLAKRDDGSLLVKVVDFGISKLAHLDGAESAATVASEQSPRVITQIGSAIGTPQYMSPEQAKGDPVDRRTDVWALGAVLFEMISGHAPYPDDEGYAKTIQLIVNEPPPYLADVASECPRAVADVVRAAMEPDLEKRIPDCTTLATRLSDAFAQSLPVLELEEAIPASEATGETTAQKPIPRPDAASVRRGRRARFAALAAFVLALLAVGVVVAGRGGSKDGAMAANTTTSASPAAPATSSAKPNVAAGPKKAKPKPSAKPSGKPSASSSKGAPSASASASSEAPLGSIGITPTY